MKRNLFIFLFLFVSVVNIATLVFNWPFVFAITKPLIIISLMACYIISVRQTSYVFIGALIFSLAGDVSLLFTERGELFFLTGLVAFLVSHVCYIAAYRQHQATGMGEELLSTQKIRFALPIILAGTGLMVILFPVLGNLRIPVLIYALVLMMMAITALLRSGKTSFASFWKVLLGAVLFMISDSALAINKFLEPFQAASVVIMLTYILAQFFIVNGIIDHSATAGSKQKRQ